MANGLKRILYVDDDEILRDTAKLALEDVGGYTLKLCSTGQEALGTAAAFAPDLMIIDAMMSGLDGPATVKELRRIPKLASVPILFITANVLPHEVEAYMDLGAAGVIPKPIDPLTLANTIQNIWEKITTCQG